MPIHKQKLVVFFVLLLTLACIYLIIALALENEVPTATSATGAFRQRFKGCNAPSVHLFLNQIQVLLC